MSHAPADTKDFAGGGYADLAWENTTTGQRAIWFLKNGAVSSTTYLNRRFASYLFSAGFTL